MNDTLILSIALVAAVLLIIILQSVTRKKRLKEKAEYPGLWQQFQESKARGDHDDLLKLGNKLFYHNFIPSEHLQILHDTAKELESEVPEFETLRLNAEKKLVHRKQQESALK